MGIPTDHGTGPLRLATEAFYYKPMASFFQAFALRAFDAAGFRIQHPVLDLGCGDGSFAALLLRLGPTEKIGVGVDLSERALARCARRRVHEKLVRADGVSLPFPSESFRTVISHTVLCCMDRDAKAVLQEIHRIVQPGGELIFTVATPRFRRNFALSLWLAAVGCKAAARHYAAAVDRRMGHVFCRPAEEWIQFTKDAGFSVLEASGFIGDREARRWSKLIWTPLRVFGLLERIPFRSLHQTVAALLRACFRRSYANAPAKIPLEASCYILIRAVKL